jgi:hypothetical protein
MTIQEAMRKHITNKKMRIRIGTAIERRSIDIMSVEKFNSNYNHASILQFPNIGTKAADILSEVIKKELSCADDR